jgi:hypothetical protein
MSGLGLGRVEMALWMSAFEVLVPIVRGLELAAIDGNARGHEKLECSEQSRPT